MLSPCKLLIMKGYCFTFGAYRRLDRIDKVVFPTVHTPRWEKILKIKEFLSHSIFGVDLITSIIRDYVSGAALLPTDLFPSRDIDSNEIYQILYSVACCVKCIGDVLNLLEGFTSSRLGLSPDQKVHLLFRYEFLKNQEEDKTLSKDSNISPFTDWRISINDTYIYKEVKRLISRDERHDPIWTVSEGICLRVSDGTYLDDRAPGLLKESRFNSTPWSIDVVAIFGSRRDMRRIKRVLGWDMYYIKIWETIPRGSYVVCESPSLGLEEMIILSMGSYGIIQGGTHPSQTQSFMRDIWALPCKLLRKYCDVIEETNNDYEYGISLLYEGKRYTVGIERNDITRKVIYICGNGVHYPYLILLLIIAKRFLFTCDRDFIISMLEAELGIDTISYLDTPTALCPIHDLVNPPDSLSLPASIEKSKYG